ncbi:MULTISPECIES: hypothetical protein [unclassified Nocardiopsis]|uniref:hypothetical protein n=1 Tax=unclassified Nocardiopsis TaxID=2649073 RepID=UPI0034112413
MTGALIRAQVRATGAATTAPPLLAGIVVAGTLRGAELVLPAGSAALLAPWLVSVLVLCAGLCVAVAMTDDGLVELHESTLVPFRAVRLLRAGLVNAAAAVGAVLAVHGSGPWPREEGWTALLSTVGAVAVLTAVAFCVCGWSGTPAATALAVVAAWLLLTVAWDPHVPSLHLQRGLPLAVALVPAVVTWRRLRDSERLMTGAVS